MAWSHIQGTGNAAAAASTVAASLSGVATGNLLVVIGTARLNAGSPATLTISDGSNSYSTAYSVTTTYSGSNRASVYIFTAPVTTGGSLTFTLTPSAAADISLSVDEYNSAIPGAVIAATGTGNSNSIPSTTASTGTISYSGTGLAVVGCQYSATSLTTFTPSAGYTNGYNQGGAVVTNFASQYNVSQASPTTPTITTSGGSNWLIAGAVFSIPVIAPRAPVVGRIPPQFYPVNQF